MPISNRSLRLITLLAGALAAGTASAGVALVANPAHPAGSADKAAAERIFLGKDSSLGGVSVVPVDQAEGSSVRSAFNQKVLGKDDAQVKAYWSRLIFTGKGTPPTAVADDAAVKQWLQSHPNGIGYVDSGSVDGSVKVLLTVD